MSLFRKDDKRAANTSGAITFSGPVDNHGSAGKKQHVLYYNNASEREQHMRTARSWDRRARDVRSS